MTVGTDPFFLNAQSVLTTAATAVAGTTRGLPGNVFVAHGRLPDDCCDLLAVYIERIRPTATFPLNALGADRCGVQRWALDLVVRLVRGGAPLVTAGAEFPPGAEQQTFAEALLEDVSTLQLALKAAHASRTLLVSPTGQVAWGMLTPYGPRGGCAGWDLRLSVEARNC